VVGHFIVTAAGRSDVLPSVTKTPTRRRPASVVGEAGSFPVSYSVFPPRWPGFASGQSMWGVWWTKWHWGRFSLSTSVSPAYHHSINFSIIIITRGWCNRPIGGRRAEWTQLDSYSVYTFG
jgi:hypothetical protein